MINRPPCLIVPCLTICHPVRNWRRAEGSRCLSVELILRFPSYKAFREVRDGEIMTADSFALGCAAARGVGHRFYPADDVQDTKLTFHRIFGNFHDRRGRSAGISFSRWIWFF